jgi:hypothetical protein
MTRLDLRRVEGKSAAAGGGGQIGQALRAISPMSIIDWRRYNNVYPFSLMSA